jgi:beta-mannosidase
MTVDLSGTWRAAEADEALRRAYPDPDFADDDWAEVSVPGHWRSSEPFAKSDGPMLYRRRFEAPTPAEGRRAWLVLDGVFYQSDVWLDGAYAGDTEGYFFPHAFEVTAALRDRAEHALAVEVACSRPADLTEKTNITGAFQHAHALDPEWNPGGIWRGVRIEETGPVRISRLRALCLEATPERAVVSFRAVLDAVEATSVRLATRVGGVDHEQEQPVAAGENRVNWSVAVEGPELWWPWSLGPQALTAVGVDVFAGDDPEASDRRVLSTGLRQVRMKNWVFTVNGERLFLKGSNQGPTRLALAEAEAPDFERDVLLAKDAGLDLLRVHAHISRPELYDAADRHGLLLWQDFPLQWGYARGVRKQAARQAREAVDLLGHHPSIVLWCGHNEPAGPGRGLVGQQAPGWNRAVLDSSVHRAFEQADASRPAVAQSGASDAHLWLGWRELPGFLARWPRAARFVSEFGAIAAPTDEGGEGQEAQAELVRRSIEALRRLKYRPTGGFCHYAFADGWPAVTCSVLGADRSPKLGYDALREACAPMIVVADPLPASVRAGEALALDVHVVSDLRAPVEGATVEAVITWAGGSHRWAWTGDIAADSCGLVGTVQFVVPEGAAGLRLDLTLSDAAGTVIQQNSLSS